MILQSWSNGSLTNFCLVAKYMVWVLHGVFLAYVISLGFVLNVFPALTLKVLEFSD